MSSSPRLATAWFGSVQSRARKFLRSSTEPSGMRFRGAKREVIGPSTPVTVSTAASNLTKTPGKDKVDYGMLRGRVWRHEKNRSRLLRSPGRVKVGARGPCVAGGLERGDHSTPRADRDTTPGERDRLQAA